MLESESVGIPADSSAFEPAGPLAQIKPISADFTRFQVADILHPHSTWLEFFLRIPAVFLPDSFEFQPAGMRFFGKRRNSGWEDKTIRLCEYIYR